MRIKLFKSFKSEITKQDEDNLDDLCQSIFDDYNLVDKSTKRYTNGNFREYFIKYPTVSGDRDQMEFYSIISKVRNLKQRCENIGFEFPIWSRQTFGDYMRTRDIKFLEPGYILSFKKIGSK